MNSLPPLSPGAAIWLDRILSIPSTGEVLNHDFPVGLSEDDVAYCHHLASSGENHAVPYLLAMVRKYPDFPPLYTYLRGAYVNKGMEKKSMEIAVEMRRRFPDYLFSRLAFAEDALFNEEPETALAELGGHFDLRKLYPDREIFHLTEIRHFYHLAAIIDCEHGNTDLAVGVLHAFEQMDAPGHLSEAVRRAITLAAIAKLNMKMAQEDELVSVTPPPRNPRAVKTRPAVFRHPEIKLLREIGPFLPEGIIRSVLDLPRESLVADLVLLIEDCRERTPNFLAGKAGYRGNDAFAHAIQFLAEIEAKGTTPVVLRFFSMHPEEVFFWMEEAYGITVNLATLLKDGVPECLDWLRKPGIGFPCRGYIIESLGELARRDPDRRDEIARGLSTLLEFYLQCRPDEQILDAKVITEVVYELAELRARHCLPLIRNAYQRNLISLLRIGPLEDIEETLLDPQPPRTPKPVRSMIDLHRELAEDFVNEHEHHQTEPGGPDSEPGNIIEFPTSLRKEWTPGRNDPCLCGSGKKYKKCCMGRSGGGTSGF